MDLTQLLPKLAESGVLGIVLALSIGGNVYLYREVKMAYKQIWEQREARIKDLKETQDKLSEPVKAIQKTVEIMLALIQQSNRKI